MPTNPGFRVEALRDRYPRARPLFVDHRVPRTLEYADFYRSFYLTPIALGADGRMGFGIANGRGASQHTRIHFG
ncbi:hypothetical protein GCM10007863_34290 [Dyella mobilis]|nr:hypothetical protein GCM10007863_34290 [Dyella mobilis]